MDEATLTVDGQTYGGWKTVQITRGIEQLASSFSVSYSDRWAEDAEPRPIAEGASCQLSIDGEQLIDGYVDVARGNYDSSSHGLTVSGRSRAGDLVDSSAVFAGGQWKKRTLLQIAQDLCKPFGLEVSAEVDIGEPFRRFSLQQGEKVHECLERAARMRGVLLVSDSSGNVVITRAGTKRMGVELRRGEPYILACDFEASLTDRFSEYILKSQGAGDDEWHGGKAATPKATAKDDGVTRYRPLIIVAENQGDSTELERRATWERNVRAGRARRLKYTLRGWRAPNDELWQPNVLVRVVDDWARVDDELLVVSTELVRDESGQRSTLELTSPAAFDVLALPPKRKNKKGNLPLL